MEITEAAVHESLDTAIDNGYELDEWPAWNIADDLKDYDATFEEADPKDLLPHIKTWLEKRKEKGDG
jgi:hypothetical protein